MRPSAVPPRLRRTRLCTRLIAAVLAAATGLTCRDGEMTGPGLPGRSVLAISPQFATPAAGGPQIILEHVTGTLKSRGGADVVHAEASFEGDSAVLEFALNVFGPSELFEITIAATDGTGEVVFGRSDTLRLRAGDNPTIQNLALNFVAPDTAAVSLSLDPSVGVAEGETVTLTAFGLTARESRIPMRAGWISRDPVIADVTPQGVLTAHTIGTTWLVATSFTGLRDSMLVGVRLPAATKLWAAGDALGTTDWQDGANWIPAGVPTSTDVVQIRAGSSLRPVLSAPASVSGILLQSTAGLDLGSNSLTVSGKLDAVGPIVGTGVVIATGTSVIQGSLPNLEVRGAATLAGTTSVAGMVKVSGTTADLRVGGEFLDVIGDLRTESGGVITMADPLGKIHVAGDAAFLGGSTNGRLTDGVLEVHGAFTVGGPDTTAFMATTHHRVILDGTTTQTVVMANRGPVSHRFQNLEIRNPQGAALQGVGVADTLLVAPTVGAPIDFTNGAHVEGIFLLEAPIAIRSTGALTVGGPLYSAPGSTIAVADLNLDNATGTTAINGSFNVPRVRFRASSLTIKSSLPYGDVEVYGRARIDGPTVVAGNLKIGAYYGDSAQFSTPGDLTPGTFPLRVQGDLSVMDGTLTMTGPSDSVRIDGNATFDGFADSRGRLTDGVLVVGGHFTAGTASPTSFAASGNHRVVLDGSARQTVSLAHPAANEQHFAGLVIANAAGVVLDRIWTLGDLTVDAAAGDTVFSQGDKNVVGGALAVASSAVVLAGSASVSVAGDVSSAAGSALELPLLEIGGPAGTTLVDASGYQVQRTVLTGAAASPQSLASSLVYQNVEVRGDALFAYGGPGMPATIVGDLAIVGPAARFDVDMASLSIAGALTVTAGGRLVMRTPYDVVSVVGPASFDDARTDSSLTAGTLRLKGDLSVTGGPASFAPSGSHTTELLGQIDQAITFSAGGPSGHRFWNLSLNNAGFVRFAGIYVAGLTTMSDAGGALDFTGMNAIAGPFAVINNKPLTGRGTLRVGGPFQTSSGVDVRIARLELADSLGTLGVAGPFSPDTVAFLGTGSTIQLGLPYRTMLIVGQAAFESKGTNTSVAGDLVIADPASNTPGSAQLVLNGASGVRVTGSLVVGANGRLMETDPADRLVVDGGVIFDGDVPAGSLTAGLLAVKGDVFVSAAGRLVADSGHRLLLDGNIPQRIVFESPRDPKDGGQALGTVELSNRTNPGGLFATGAFLQGDLILDSNTHLSVAKDERVYVAGVLVDSSGTTIDIPNTALSELSVLNIALQQHTALGKPVTNRLGQP
jgi:hypothetical protein